MTENVLPVPDIIDGVVPLAPGHPVHAVRHERQKVVTATQGSYEGLFADSVPDITVAERLLVALHACRLSRSENLAALYRSRLVALHTDAALVDAVDAGTPLPALADRRLETILAFTGKLITKPIEGDRAAVEALTDVGLSTPAVVALGQLISFLSYQIRAVAGLKAMVAAEEGRPPSAPALPDAEPAPTAAAAPRTGPIRINGFTNEVLSWDAWLDTVEFASASPEQVAALEEMSPAAKTSAYFLLLAHQPEILKQRSIAFNAIMFAPGGMPRAERELGATVESVVNGCVYCTSVHAQRFEQLAKRTDVIEQVFLDPHSAGTTPREKAIVAFSIVLGITPEAVGAEHIHSLQAVGLSDLEIHDLIHSVALFAWANRLMLNLGEAVHPEPSAA